MLKHHITTALRHLQKYKTQNLISIVGLAVCLLCFSLCLYCSRFFLSIDQCFENHDRIADVILKSPDGEPFPGTPATLVEQLWNTPIGEAESFTFMTYAQKRPYSVEIEDGKQFPFDEMETVETDSCFYTVFTPKIIAGSWNSASHSPNAIIITKSTASKVFGENSNPIGKHMILTDRLLTSPQSTPASGGITYTIHAVIEDIPQNSSLNLCNHIDLLVLNDSEGLLQSESRKYMTSGSTFALLRKGKSVQQLEEHFRDLNLSDSQFRMENTVCAVPFGKSFQGLSALSYFIYVTSALGILILLTGLLNFFHFLTGSFLNRSREYSLRKVLGSSNRQLLSQLFIQSTLVILLAFLFNFCLIELLSPFFHLNLMEYTLEIEKTSLMKQCSEYLFLIFILNLFICMLTVAHTRRISIQEGIKNGSKKMSKHYVRNIMLGIQFFICWIFVTLTAALYLQAEKTTSTLLGTLSKEEKECIFSVPMDYSFMTNEEKLAIVERMAGHPGVQGKLLASHSYTDGIYSTGFQLEKDKRDSNVNIGFMRVAPEFFQFMNIPILRGHVLQNNAEMVIDETLEEQQQKQLLGNTIYNYSDGYTVSGVSSPFIADVYSQSRGFAFLPLQADENIGYCYLKCLPSQKKAVQKHVFEVLRETLPYTLSPKISTLQQDLEEIQGVESKLKNIILFFAMVSVIITLLGVYSAITLDTERRRKEVAIRKVNGAGLRQILRLFLRMYIGMLIVTAVIAFPLLYETLRLWKQMYTVFFNDGICFWSGIFVVIVLITILTVIFRILKIARINPAEVIKNE